MPPTVHVAATSNAAPPSKLASAALFCSLVLTACVLHCQAAHLKSHSRGRVGQNRPQDMLGGKHAKLPVKRSSLHQSSQLKLLDLPRTV